MPAGRAIVCAAGRRARAGGLPRHADPFAPRQWPGAGEFAGCAARGLCRRLRRRRDRPANAGRPRMGGAPRPGHRPRGAHRGAGAGEQPAQRRLACGAHDAARRADERGAALRQRPGATGVQLPAGHAERRDQDGGGLPGRGRAGAAAARRSRARQLVPDLAGRGQPALRAPGRPRRLSWIDRARSAQCPGTGQYARHALRCQPRPGAAPGP